MCEAWRDVPITAAALVNLNSVQKTWFVPIRRNVWTCGDYSGDDSDAIVVFILKSTRVLLAWNPKSLNSVLLNPMKQTDFYLYNDTCMYETALGFMFPVQFNMSAFALNLECSIFYFLYSVSIHGVQGVFVSSLPVADAVVLLSDEEDKGSFTPSVCAPPLAGLCWFNPGGQQLVLTAPRHQRVCDLSLPESAEQMTTQIRPLAVLSATRHEGGSRAQTHQPWVIQRQPPPRRTVQSLRRTWRRDNEEARKQ